MNILFSGDLSFSWMPPLSSFEKLKEKSLSLIKKNYHFDLYGDKITADLKEVIDSADFFCVNLECVLSKKGKALEGKKYQLNADPEFVHTLKKIGVNVVTLANNHTLDYGLDALLETLSVLKRENINHLGIRNQGETFQAPLIIKKGIEKIALFNFVDPSIIDPHPELYLNEKKHPFPLSEDTVLKSLESFNKDIPKIVVFHFGSEWCFIESEKQQQICHLCIDHGVEAVIGHHTHLSGRVEEYKGKPIFYGLGNFLLPLPEFSAERAKRRPMVNLCFENGKLKRYEIIPLTTDDNGLPVRDNKITIGSFNKLYLPKIIQNKKLVFDSLCDIETAKIQLNTNNQVIDLKYHDCTLYNPEVILGRLPVSNGYRADASRWAGTAFSCEPIGNEFLTSNLTFLNDSAELIVLFKNIPKLDKLYFIESTPPWFYLLDDFSPLNYSLFINDSPASLNKLSKDIGWNIYEISYRNTDLDSIELRANGNDNKFSYHLWRIIGF